MKPNRLAHALPVFALVLLGTACSPGERGSWWYRHPGAIPPDAYGIEEVFLGTGALTPTGVADALVDCNVTRLYGSYGPLTGAPSTSQMAAFNADLHTRGIESQFLFSDPSYLANPGSLLSLITTRVVNFNAARSDPSERFDAVHLDVEPVQFPECKLDTLDPEACYERVGQLLSLVVDVKELLLGSPVLVYVDIHDWIDLTVGGRVAWPADPTPEAVRDDWFITLGVWADGVTVFSYGRTAPSDIYDAVTYEALNLPNLMRVGINLDEGNNFPDVPSMMAAALIVEASYGIPVDLHSTNEILAFGGCA